jgi:Na+/melibiose symporter-like transporter
VVLPVPSPEQQQQSTVTRRSIVQGAAWSLPVIATAVAAPAYAASNCIPAANASQYAYTIASTGARNFPRENGLGSACQGFINKIGNAVATCGIIVLYMVIGMNPQDMLSSETIRFAFDIDFGQRFAMLSLVSLLPGISMLLCSIPMFFYKISGKNKEKMLADLKAKREAEGFVVAE